MAVLYVDALQKDHYAPFMSKTFLITYLFYAIMIAIPFVLVFKTNSKWTYMQLRFRLLGNEQLFLWAAKCRQHERNGSDGLHRPADLQFRNHFLDQLDVLDIIISGTFDSSKIISIVFASSSIASTQTEMGSLKRFKSK